MTKYYVSRSVLSIGFAGLFLLAGVPWWTTVIITAFSLIFFAWVPRSGRYVLQTGSNFTPFRSDEMSLHIRARSAGLSLTVTLTVLGSVVLHYSFLADSDVPTSVLSLVIALSTITYVGAGFVQK